MRKFKFRAWDKENQCWCETADDDLQINIVLDKSGQFYLTDLSITGENNIVIMQYTGFHDQGGQEIYEGDRIQSQLGTGIVEFSASDGQWVVQYNGTSLPLCYWIFLKKSQIIGHIYESEMERQ